jgi:hypothetical protein
LRVPVDVGTAGGVDAATLSRERQVVERAAATWYLLGALEFAFVLNNLMTSSAAWVWIPGAKREEALHRQTMQGLPLS